MANIFNANPMILDTVWTSGTMPAAFLALTNPQRFRLIKWIGNSAAADECKITDLGGNVLFDEVIVAGNVGLDIVLWDTPGDPYVFKQNGWILTTLTHGKLWLWK